MTKLIGAADIGGMTIKLGLFDEHIRLIRSWSIPTDISDHGSHILPMLCDSLRAEISHMTEASCGTTNTLHSDEELSSEDVLKGQPSNENRPNVSSGEVVKNTSVCTDIDNNIKLIDNNIRLAGLGIAVPAAVDEQSVARNCTNIGWGTVNLREEVSRLMPEVGVLKFGNDATVAALGELKLGAAKRYNSAYLITLGTGVGGGYVTDTKATAGAHGAAGEIGHIIINPHETTRCMCGRCGCLEQYASAAGIVRLARNIIYIRRNDNLDTENDSVSNHFLDNALTESPSVSASDAAYKCYVNGDSKEIQPKTPNRECRDNDRVHIERLFNLNIPQEHSSLEEQAHFDARDICDAARNGDKLCLYILEIFGECIGLAMSSISCSIDPECFIIGGGMSKGGSIVLDAIRHGYIKYAYPASKETDIIQAELGNDAGIYGCALMAAEALQQSK